MSASSLLPDPKTLGSFYSISASDWTAINNRVATVLSLSQIAPVVEQQIPNYAALLSGCVAWRNKTFGELVGQSGLAEIFAGRLIDELRQISGALHGLDPASPVPAGVAFIFEFHFAALADAAASLQTDTDGYTPDLTRFVAENRTTDQRLEAIADEMQGWGHLAGPVAALEAALDRISGGWSAMSAQLKALAQKPVPITSDMLLRIDFAAEVAGWRALGATARAFNLMATAATSGGTA